MSLRLFSKAGQPAAPSARESVQKLHASMEALEKRQAYLGKRSAAERAAAAVEAQRGNRRAAAAHLRRHKTYEAQVGRLADTHMAMETQLLALEGAVVANETVAAMRAGAATMAAVMPDADQVSDMMEDVRQQAADAEEIGNSVATAFDSYATLDQDELDAELDAMMAAEGAAPPLLSPTSVAAAADDVAASLPAVPSSLLPPSHVAAAAAAPRTAVADSV